MHDEASQDSAPLGSRLSRVALGVPKPEFTITVEDIRGRCVTVDGFASDPIGALAEEACEKLGFKLGRSDSATLARNGVAFHRTDRMGYPADRTFRLVITGGTP